MKLGSLFSGFGGLDLAVEAVFGARTVWVSDIEPGPCKVLAHRFPGVPNLGDITRVDWSQVEPVDIIAGGSPCQDISGAGRRAGMTDGTRSNLWVEMREAVATLNPHLVIWENVRGALSSRASSAMESDPGLLGDHRPGVPVLRALGRVLGDLADLGYDAVWHGLRAADIGAPHGRFRIFVVAANPVGRTWLERWQPAPGEAAGGRALGTTARRDRAPLALLPTPSAGNFNSSEDPDQWEARRQRVKETAANGNGMGIPLGIAVQLLPTPTASERDRVRDLENRRQKGSQMELSDVVRETQEWGKYAAAIARWEAIHGPAPTPTKPGRTGRPKLNPAFAEWMMGAPAGWITDTPGVTDNEALRMAGNGVVQQQAEAAMRLMLHRAEAVA